MKVNTHPSSLLLNSIKADLEVLLFFTITVDFITNLLLSNRYDALMVMIDYNLSKGIILALYQKTINTLGIVQLLHDYLYKRFGLPKRIISN